MKPGFELMADVRSGSVDVPGGSLHYEVAGEGPAVTLIHPGLWDSRTWDPQVPVLVDAAFRVIRYDVRGYGRSSRLTGEPYSHVRDLEALLDDLEVPLTHPGRLLDGRRDRDRLHAGASRPRRRRSWSPASGLGGFEAVEEEEDWWEALNAPIDAAIEAGDLERARGPPAGDLGAARDARTRPGG